MLRDPTLPKKNIGGYRPGSGQKKGQHRIHVGELRRELEKALGIPYVQFLGEVQVTLYNDFKNGTNVKEFLSFTENMFRRIIEQPVHEIKVDDNTKGLTTEQLQTKVNDLILKASGIIKDTDINKDINPEDDSEAQE